MDTKVAKLQRFSDQYYLPLFITLKCRSVISKLTGGESVVKRVSFGNYEVYIGNSTIPSVVSLGDKKTFPACSCDEWNNNALPCLHMFQVFKEFGLSFNDLSHLYRSNSCFKVDSIIMKISHRYLMGQKSNSSLSSKRVSGSKPHKSKSTRSQDAAQTKNSKTVDFKSLKCKVVLDASTQCSIDLFAGNGTSKKLAAEQKDTSTQYMFTENEKLKKLLAKQKDASTSTQRNLALSTESVESKNPTANQHPKKIDTKLFKDASTQYQIFRIFPQKGSPVRHSSRKQTTKGNKETDVVNTTSSSARDGVSKRKRKTKVKQNQSNSKRLKKLVKLDKPSNSESAVPTYQYQAFVEPQAMLPASVDNPNETAVLSLHSEIKIEPDDLFDIEIDIDESVLSKEYLESNVEANSVEESLAKISMLKEQLDLSLQNETFSDFAS